MKVSKKITCPYCYRDFMDDEVFFRASPSSIVDKIETVISKVSKGVYLTERDVENNLKELPQGAIDAIKAKIEQERPFVITSKSEKFHDFWFNHNFSNKEYPEPKNEGVAARYIQYNFDLPLLNPNNEAVTSEVLKDVDDKFVYGMRDIKGNMTTSRVCPHCNNPLQGRFGKYPVKHICVIGIKGSGKTVFLSQFLNHISDLGRFGVTVGAVDNFILEYIARNKVEMGVELADPTEPTNLEQPLAIDITVKEYNEETTNFIDKTVTFVFHDIGGENCAPVKGGNVAADFSSFIAHADALIFLIDPSQMPVFGLENADKGGLGTPFAFIADQFPQVKSKPVAAVISQIDRLECRNVMRTCPTLYINNITPIAATAEIALDNPLFNAIEYNKIQCYLSNLIGGDDAIGTLKNNYSNCNYFGISAIGADVVDGKPVAPPTPYRICEPFLWILREMGIIGANEPVKPKLSYADYCSKVKEELGREGIREASGIGGLFNSFRLEVPPYGRYSKNDEKKIKKIIAKINKNSPIDEVWEKQKRKR